MQRAIGRFRKSTEKDTSGRTVASSVAGPPFNRSLTCGASPQSITKTKLMYSIHYTPDTITIGSSIKSQL